MAFGTRYNIEIWYEHKYGRGAEICQLIQKIAKEHGFIELEELKRMLPEEKGKSYPEQKEFWIHMSKAHKGIDWRHSLVGINYNTLANRIDLAISTVGEHADDIWAAMVKPLRDREDVSKITIKSIDRWGPGESLKEGPLVVK